jgi:hypothetical protein
MEATSPMFEEIMYLQQQFLIVSAQSTCYFICTRAICIYDSCTKRALRNVVTSRVVPDCRISRTDGVDHEEFRLF